MHRIELIDQHGNVRPRTLPGAWTECTVAQLAAVAALTSVPLAADADEDTKQRAEAHLRLQLFRALAGLTDAEFAALEPSDLLGLKTDAVGFESVVLLPWVSWCLEAPNWEKSLLNEVVVRKQRFEGPRDRLGRWKVRQWIFADALLLRLTNGGGEEALHHLLGALYTPAGTPWHNDHVERNAEALAKLDDRTKLAAVLNYRGLRTWLGTRYPKAFRGGKADPHGPEGMIVRLAGNKFGTVEQTWDADLSPVLVHVEQSIADQEEMKQRMQQH